MIPGDSKIRELMRYITFDEALRVPENSAWEEHKPVSLNLLVDFKVRNYESLSEELLSA